MVVLTAEIEGATGASFTSAGSAGGAGGQGDSGWRAGVAGGGGGSQWVSSTTIGFGDFAPDSTDLAPDTAAAAMLMCLKLTLVVCGLGAFATLVGALAGVVGTAKQRARAPGGAAGGDICCVCLA